MSGKGGYIIIDFKKTPFTSGQEASVDGIYNKLKNPYNKVTLVSGLVVSDIKYPDLFIPFTSVGNNMSASIVYGGNTLTFTVTNEDNVTILVA